MYYYLIIAVQGYCIYHLYKNKNDYYWIFLIIFLPLVGSIIYLFTHVFNKRDVDKIQNDITTIINPTKKIRDLERKVNFADTFQNRSDLADAYFELNDFNNAVVHYDKANTDYFDEDYYIFKQLIFSYFKLEDYENVVYVGNKIRDKSEFNGSIEQFYYGMALHHQGDLLKAESNLESINTRYSNYDERLELAKFYLQTDKLSNAKNLLNDLVTEIGSMKRVNQRQYKHVMTASERLLKTL